MTNQPFEAKVRTQPGVATIDLQGEINSFAEGALSAAYAEAESHAPTRIALNFNQVSYMNSTGIALVVGILAKARKSHIQMVVYGLSDHYVEIFQITRLADYMTIFSDEASAVHTA